MVDKVLVILLDGTWHNLSEIATDLQIDHRTLDKVLNLLSEFEFVETNETHVRIQPDTKAFLESITKDTETNDNSL